MDFIPDTQELLHCSICMETSCKDIVTMTCKGQHVYCFSCVFNFIKDSRDGEGHRKRIGEFSCPTCRQGNGSLVVQSRLEKVVNSLKKHNEEEQQQDGVVEETTQVPTLSEYYSSLDFLGARFPRKFRRGKDSCIITVTQLALFVHNYELLKQLISDETIVVRVWRNYDGKVIVSPFYNIRRNSHTSGPASGMNAVILSEQTEATDSTETITDDTSNIPPNHGYNLRPSPIRNRTTESTSGSDDTPATAEEIEELFYRHAQRFISFVRMADDSDEEQDTVSNSSHMETTNTNVINTRQGGNICYLCVHWVQNQDCIKNYYITRGIHAAKAQLDRGIWTGSVPTMGCIFKFNLDIDLNDTLLRNNLAGKITPLWVYEHNNIDGMSNLQLKRVEVSEEEVYNWIIFHLGIGERFRQLLTMLNSIRNIHRNGSLDSHYCVSWTWSELN